MGSWLFQSPAWLAAGLAATRDEQLRKLDIAEMQRILRSAES